jgi:hypothetical protein
MEPATNCQKTVEVQERENEHLGFARHDEPCRCGNRIVWHELVEIKSHDPRRFRAPGGEESRDWRCYLCISIVWQARRSRRRLN